MTPHPKAHMKAGSDDLAHYNVTPIMRKIAYSRHQLTINALAALDATVRKDVDLMASPQAVKDYLCLHNGSFEDLNVERFSVMWLDSQNGLIAVDTMFIGTLTQTSVYPREVVRTAMKRNAAAAVLTHNHPSGVTRPSRADESLTQALKAALALVDVRIVDHIITSGANVSSMAELGMM